MRVNRDYLASLRGLGIRSRLLAVIGIPLVLLCLGDMWIRVRDLSSNGQDALTVKAIDLGQSMGRDYEWLMLTGAPTASAALRSRCEHFTSLRWLVLRDMQGTTVYSYRSEGVSRAVLGIQPAPGERTLSELDLVVSLPVGDKGQRLGSVTLGHDTSGLQRARSAAINRGTTVLVISLVIVVLMVVVLNSLLARPLRRTCAYLDRIRSSQDRPAPMQLGEGGEFGQVSEGIETLLDEIDSRRELLETALEEAQAAEETKTRFLANMSHEIRTPLNAILGWAGELEHGADPVEVGALVGRHGRHLLEVLGSILDVVKLDAGEMNLESAPVDIHSLLRNLREMFDGQAQAKGLEWAVVVDPDVPVGIIGDSTRLSQCLINLVGNAMKFTELGLVRVYVEWEVRPDESTQLLIMVSDSGIGMEDTQLDGVFEAFRQADSSITRRFGGTGLGLSLTRSLALAMGGDLEVSSVMGVGSTFTLSLPATEVSIETAERVSVECGLAGLRVLLAEDVASNRLLAMHVLARLGAEVESAENGEEARSMAMAAQGSPEAFDVILMDLQMPVKDGHTATAELREEGFAGRIVALTAHALAGDREQCLQGGFDGYTTKPLVIEELVREILGRTS